MRNARLAETVLSLVTPRDFAAATVGDLLELMPQRGPRWFWTSVARTALATIWRHLRSQPWRLTLYAVVAGYGYAMLVLLLMLAMLPLVVMLSLSAEVLANYTGIALLAEPLRSSGDSVASTLMMLIVLVVAPYLAGRRLAEVWHDRALTLTLTTIGVWSLLIALAPLMPRFGPGVRVPLAPFLLGPAALSALSAPMLGLIVPFILAGAVQHRLTTIRPSGQTA